MKKGIIREALDSIIYYLSPAQKRRAIIQFGLMLSSSLLDVFGLAALVPVMMVAAEPGGVYRSKHFLPIYQALHFESEKAFLLFLISTIFVFFLVKNAYTSWVSYQQARFSSAVGLKVVAGQLNKYLHFPFWKFSDFGSARLINSSLQVPGAFIGGVIRPLFNFFSELTIISATIIGILIYKPILFAILTVLLAPTAILTYRALRSRAQKIGSRANELRPKSYRLLNDLFTGFVELKLANKQQLYKERLIANEVEIQSMEVKGALYGLLPVKVIEMVAILGVVTIFIYALFFPNNSTDLIALVGLFAAAAYRLMPSVNRILTAMVQLRQFRYAIDILEEFRDNPIYREEPDPEQLPLTFKDSITFYETTFSFPNENRPALDHINIQVGKGEKIGFIGSSGSGKTTLMNVLLRFYTEQSGQILVDDKPLTPKHLEAWHRLIGYVKQDTFLMEASIQDNITLGESTPDEERLRYAVEQASLRDFVASLPEGLNTLIGERGSKLSGGQRQRLGIARAMYKRTQVLILDEATSALDNETEREVNEAINKLAQTDMTILIIAHRITTLRECDRIYELRAGKIIAQHQYADLVQQIV